MCARDHCRRLPAFIAVLVSLAGLHPIGAPAPAAVPLARRPNVLLIITDDHGYGDQGIHGNPKIRTPHLDRLARESVSVRSFYVSPVCSPTRASLLTGRYNYRTGVVDTYLGRSLMHGDEITVAEMLSGAGYRTGIFGKWHLGDNYPLRAMDQGFHESLTLNGGGIGQPSDPRGGESYFNPLLRRNGQWIESGLRASVRFVLRVLGPVQRVSSCPTPFAELCEHASAHDHVLQKLPMTHWSQHVHSDH